MFWLEVRGQLVDNPRRGGDRVSLCASLRPEALPRGRGHRLPFQLTMKSTISRQTSTANVKSQRRRHAQTAD